MGVGGIVLEVVEIVVVFVYIGDLGIGVEYFECFDVYLFEFCVVECCCCWFVVCVYLI